MPDKFRFATVDSDKELVVHLARLHEQHPYAEDLTFFWLCQRLGLRTSEVFAAFAREGNEGFVEALYRSVHSKWPKVGLVTVEDSVLMPTPSAETVWLPPPDEVPTELKITWLHLVATHAEPLGEWPHPAADLYLEIPSVVTAQLEKSTHKSYARYTVYELTPLEGNQQVLDELRKRRDALKTAINKATRVMQRDHSRIVVLYKIRNLLELSRHHWRTETDPTFIFPADALNKIDTLDDAVAKAMQAAQKALVERSGETDAAEDLLAMFDPAKDGVGLAAVLRNLAAYPGAYPVSYVDDLFDLLTESMHMLGQSERYLEFAREHWLPLLEAACEKIPKSAEEVFSELNDPELETVWSDAWKGDLELVQLAIGKPSKGSVLKPLATQAKEKKAAAALIGAAASERFILRFLNQTEKVRSYQSTKHGHRLVASIIMRLFVASAIEHKIAGTPGISRTVSLRQFINRVRSAKGLDAHGWFVLGKKFEQEFRFGTRFKAWPALAGFNILAGLVITGFALVDEDQDGYSRALNFSAGLFATAAGIASAAEAAALLKRLEMSSDKLARSAKVLGALGAAFGALSAIRAVSLDVRRDNTYGAATNAVAAMSGGITFATAFASCAYTAAIMTGWGLALGAVALAMLFLGPGKGPAAMVRSYWRYATAAGSPVLDIAESLREAVEDSLFAADPGLVDFNGGVGKPGQDFEITDPPTVHVAYEMGFERAELESMFDDAEELLEDSEIPFAEFMEPIQ